MISSKSKYSINTKRLSAVEIIAFSRLLYNQNKRYKVIVFDYLGILHMRES